MSTQPDIGNSSVKSPLWAALFWCAAAAGPSQPAAAVTPPAATPLGSCSRLFQSPARVAQDVQGNLYVTDPRAGQLIKLSATGQVVAVRSGLAQPLAVAAGDPGAVYVSEEGAGRVTVCNAADLAPQYSLGIGSNEFLLPNHIALDTFRSNGLAYVSDSRAHQIKCYSGATWIRTFGGKGTGPGQFDFPTGVFVSPGGEVFVVDQNNDRVQVFDAAGVFLRAFALATPADGAGISGRAQGITGDAAGRLYITDAFQDEVKVFDAQGNYVSSIGEFGQGIGRFRSPAAVALGTDQRLFVASVNNGRVEIFGIEAGAMSLLTLQIVSAHGAAFPAAGVYTNAAGAQWTNSVSPADTQGTTRYVCAGWIMSGNEPPEGLTNVMVMTHTNDATLTWLWKTQFDLTVSAGPHGAVSATNGWWDAGATATAAAAADAYYHFAAWTGSLSSAANPLEIPMDGARNIGGVFAANLAAHETPEWWLASLGLTNGDWNSAALDDQDGDGMFTWQEWAADTNPTNEFSFLAFSGAGASPAGVTLAWHGGVLASQYVEKAESLTGAPVQWQTIFTNLPPTAVSTNLPVPAGANASPVYRIRAAR